MLTGDQRLMVILLVTVHWITTLTSSTMPASTGNYLKIRVSYVCVCIFEKEKNGKLLSNDSPCKNIEGVPKNILSWALSV